MTRDITIPSYPFTRGDLPDLGISRRRLEQLVRDGAVRRIVRGVYVAADLPDTVELRAKAVAHVVPPQQVVRDRTAAWLHGVDALTYAELDVAPPIETCALRGNGPARRSGVDGRTRDLASHDIMVVEGVRVTTPLRTALDLGCRLRRREALAVLDALVRLHGISRARLKLGSLRFRRRRGVVQLRSLIPLVDPRRESARESWTALAIFDAGLPTPEPQYWVEIDGEPVYRLDFAYPHARVAIEYDGFETHERTPEQREHDRERRAWLRANGWTVIVVRRGGFTGEALDRWLGELRDALQPSYSNVRDMERGSRSRR